MKLVFGGCLILAGCMLMVSGCSSKWDDAFKRSNVVRVCRDSGVVTLDPRTKQLMYYKNDGWSGIHGWVAPGTAIRDVCD